MKLAIGRIFDSTRLLSSKIGADIKEFIEYFAQLQDNLVRLSQNNITLDDNLKILKKQVTVINGTETYTITGLPFGAPTAIMLGSSDGPLDNPVSMNWRYQGNRGQISVYLKAASLHTRPIVIELIIFLK